jgi:hypothetical protein
MTEKDVTVTVTGFGSSPRNVGEIEWNHPRLLFDLRKILQLQEKSLSCTPFLQLLRTAREGNIDVAPSLLEIARLSRS